MPEKPDLVVEVATSSGPGHRTCLESRDNRKNLGGFLTLPPVKGKPPDRQELPLRRWVAPVEVFNLLLRVGEERRVLPSVIRWRIAFPTNQVLKLTMPTT